jgi:signal recognition particle subunit SRP54
MFESLSQRLEEVFKRLRGKGKLTEEDVDIVLREVRQALLEADVNFKVVKQFIARLRERTIGIEVMESLTPAQTVIKIVDEELITLLGEPGRLDLSGKRPAIIMLVGLQGAGKTTMAAKLALFLRKRNERPLMVAADVRRPAAILQLQTLGKQIDIPVFSEPDTAPPKICQDAIEYAKQQNRTVLILDTAGRLNIDEEMMQEVEQIKALTGPQETLLVIDAMTGQEAVRVADDFNKRVPLTGLIMTKIDGDARGGAALSIRSVTGVPITFLGTSEKLDGLELFYPDRLASRILGMGDVLTLIERVQSEVDEKQAKEQLKKIRERSFNFEDFMKQLQQIRKLGSFADIMKMIPGMGGLMRDLPPEALDEKQFKRVEAIIQSMTVFERQNPHVLLKDRTAKSRKDRIARGSGSSFQEVNQLVKQFEEMQKLMKQMMGPGKNTPGKNGNPFNFRQAQQMRAMLQSRKQGR